MSLDPSRIDFDKADGLVPAIVQHAETRQVLMLGYMNKEAFAETERTRELTFFSRSRKRLWKKGETSGNILRLQETFVDCDNDALLVLVLPDGPTCHTGELSCFGTPSPARDVLSHLAATVASRRGAAPETSYTAKLLHAGLQRAAQKVGEEGVELAIAAQYPDKLRIADEAADLLFHFSVLLEACGVSLAMVDAELKRRENPADAAGRRFSFTGVP